jgi:hypothetical protein
MRRIVLLLALTGGRLTVVGRSRTAAVRGIVVRHVGSTLFLSSNRHLLALHTGRGLADSAPTPSATSPQPGDLVSTQVSIGVGGGLVETQQSILGPSGSNTIQVRALVAAVAVGTVSLNVQGQTLAHANRSFRGAASTSGRPAHGPRSCTDRAARTAAAPTADPQRRSTL